MEAWTSELSSRVAALSPPPELELTIDQMVTDVAHWRVTIAHGTVTVDTAPSGDADVRVVTDVETADAIRSGRASAQRAFLDGRLRIGGDMGLLMSHRASLAELGLGPA